MLVQAAWACDNTITVVPLHLIASTGGSVLIVPCSTMRSSKGFFLDLRLLSHSSSFAIRLTIAVAGLCTRKSPVVVG